jgi:hypothetical protein
MKTLFLRILHLLQGIGTSERCGSRKFAALATLIVQVTASSADPIIQWATVAGSPGEDTPTDMALTPSGEIYVIGTFDIEFDSDGSTVGPQTVLYKFDLKGTQTGSQASRGEWIRGGAVDSKGNYYLTGRVSDPDQLGMGVINDFYLAKYSPTGALLWERATGSAGASLRYSSDGGSKLALDAAGNICVSGTSSGAAVFGNVTLPATPGGPLLCKYDPDGALLWVKRVEGAALIFQGQDLASGEGGNIALDQGNIVMSGFLRNGRADFGGTVVNVETPNGGDFFIATFNASGDIQWVKTGFGGGVAADKQGGVYFNGSMVGSQFMHCGKLT